MKHIRSEQGNTLIIVLLMVVIFTVTGLSLISTTFNGVKKTDAREAQIKSVELAEKGIDYIVTLLETKALQYENLTIDVFKTELDTLLAPYLVLNEASDFKSNSRLKSEQGTDLRVKILKQYTTNNPNDVSQIITIYSQASVNNKTKTIVSEVRLGAKPVPDALKYALGSYNPNPKNADKDAGNMFLHGAAAIKGDVYVEGNLITRNKAYAFFGWPNSDFPSIEGINGKKANLVLKGKLLNTIALTNRSYSTHIGEKEFLNYPTDYRVIDKDNAGSVFTNYRDANREFVPTIVERNSNFKPIDISAEKNNYFFSDTVKTFSPVVNAPKNCTFTTITQNGRCTSNRVNATNLYAYNDSNNDNVINGSYSFKRLSYVSKNNKGIIIDGNDQQPISISFQEGAYIKGNLTIGQQSSWYDGKDLIEIDGPIYVDGDLNITGANVKFNSTIYVTGSTSVSTSYIQGKNNNEKTLVVFGKRPINFVLNNIFEEEPMTLKGFFYSEDLIEMYGVISNIKINGGVFGKKIVFNALKNSSSPDSSRLSIVYDPELIKNPPEGLPVVKELTVTKKNRKFK